MITSPNASSQTIGGKGKDVLRKCYPPDNQYLAIPNSQQGRKRLGTCMRKRSGVDSRHMLETFPYC